MIQLAYVSTARQLMRDDELAQLLTASRKYNATHAIIGMLLYKDCSFLQVIEGAHSEVAALYARIRDDVRHEKVRILFEHPIAQRDFANWSMGFRRLGANWAGELGGFTDFMEQDVTARAMFENPTLAKRLLLRFRALS